MVTMVIEHMLYNLVFQAWVTATSYHSNMGYITYVIIWKPVPVIYPDLSRLIPGYPGISRPLGYPFLTWDNFQKKVIPGYPKIKSGPETYPKLYWDIPGWDNSG